MDENMSDLFNNVQKMVDSGNIPDNLKEILNNIKNDNQNNTSNSNNSSNSNNMNDIFNNISPEMINNVKKMFNNTSTSNDNSSPNIDMNTILKMKSVMEKMNSKDDPRANLLYSLKPYLRDSKRSKVDQYVNLLNMTKIADAMNSENKKENNNNA